MLDAFGQSVIILRVVLLNLIMPNVIMLIGVRPSVVTLTVIFVECRQAEY
jgi:hypothetical protein